MEIARDGTQGSFPGRSDWFTGVVHIVPRHCHIKRRVSQLGQFGAKLHKLRSAEVYVTVPGKIVSKQGNSRAEQGTSNSENLSRPTHYQASKAGPSGPSRLPQTSPSGNL